MNRLKSLLILSVFSLLLLGSPSAASAQWRNDDDSYGRNRNGNYGNRNMRSVLDRLKENSREFVNRLDRELDNSRYNGRNREDRINQIARDFRNATDRLENRFDDRGNRGYNEAQDVLRLGNQLENAISRSRLSNRMQNQWNSIRQDLNAVANYYGYNNRNNNRNGNWRNNLPFPLPF
jgi:hypothetical protein